MVVFYKCFWCGVLLTYNDVLPGKSMPSTKLTNDHIFPKKIRRQKDRTGRTIYSFRTVKACFDCNCNKTDLPVGDFLRAYIPVERWPMIDWDFLYSLRGVNDQSLKADFWNYEIAHSTQIEPTYYCK